MKGLYNLITLVLTLSILTIVPMHAQHSVDKCAQVNYLQHLEDQYPGYLNAVDRTFEEAKIRGAESRAAGRLDVYTIQVVIHIVHVTSNASQNISQEIIDDQIRVLNESFRHTNSDAGNIRAEFAGIVGDSEIQFELADVKRVGLPSFYFPDLVTLYDGIKHSSSGGSDAVDPEHFLNIWVAELWPGLVLGYAYPPAGIANWPPGSSAPTQSDEGVLIDYRAFASNNPASTFYENQGIEIEGRTTVHEVGHYLGLRHIWGDDDCNFDDGIEDTPTMAENSQNSGCVPTNNTCDAGMPGDLPDMWENYMDYSLETCQIAFTNDQIDVMRGVLEGPRSGLLDGACSPPTTGAITGPSDVIEATSETYSVPASGNTYTWSVTGGTITSGAGTNSVQVSWGNGPTGQICVTESLDGCDGNASCVNITFSAACPTITTGDITGTTTAEVSSSETYTIPVTTNSITWEVTGGTISSGGGTRSITVAWGNGSTGQVCVTESDGACPGNTVCEDVTLSPVSGIAEIAIEKGLEIFPNPASSYLRIRTNEIPEKIELINVLGAVIMTIESPDLYNDIRLHDLSENVLLIKVSYIDGFAIERVIVE